MAERKILSASEVLEEANQLAQAIKNELEGLPGFSVNLGLVRPPYEVGKLHEELRGVVAGKIWPVLIFVIDGIPSGISPEGRPDRGITLDLVHRSSKDQVCASIKFGAFTRGTHATNPRIIRESVESSVIRFREFKDRSQEANDARRAALQTVNAAFPSTAFKHEIRKATQNSTYIEGLTTHVFDESVTITWAYIKGNLAQERLRIITTTGAMLEDARNSYLDARKALEAEYLVLVVSAASVNA